MHYLDVTDFLQIDELSTPITGFMEPLITTSFIEGRQVYIQVYHRLEKKQYHFIYSYEEKKAMSPTTVSVIPDCSSSNFPIKSFFSSITQAVYTFYR